MNAEDFASWMNGLESVFVIAAIIGGAIWSRYLYGRLKERDRAQAELQGLQLTNLKLQEDIRDVELHRLKAKGEVEQLELEQRLAELEIEKKVRESGIGAVLELSISAEQAFLPDGASYYISAVVEVENKGKESTRLVYENRRPFSVYTVRLDGGGQRFKDKTDYIVPLSINPNASSPSMIVRAGSRERLNFFCQVESPGLYFLVFSAALPKEQQAIAEELGFTFRGRWAAKEYVVIK
jgi:hypothetical protein